MGMYDYLGGEQIKIFYRPIYSGTNRREGESPTWHSGGHLYSFDEHDELPLKTLYYKYPDNFIVYDFRGSDNLWVIKNGKFKCFRKPSEVIAEDFGEAVYNYYGHKININTPEDVLLIHKEWNDTRSEYKRREDELFQDMNMYDMIKTNLEEFKRREPELDRIREETYIAFYNKWSTEDEFADEKQLGEFIDVYGHVKFMKDGKGYVGYNPTKDYIDCKNDLFAFVEEHPGIADKYMAWVAPGLITREELDKILHEIGA